MPIDLKDIVALAAVLVAATTLWTNIQSRKDRATKEMVKESEERQKAELNKLNSELSLRISVAATKQAEAEAKLAQFRLEFAHHQARVVSREDMDNIFEQRLDPVLLHMKKSESFMEEILRSGILLTAHRNMRTP